MTLESKVECALMRANYCKSRKKNSTQHHREANLTAGLILARENQSNGAHYSRDLLSTLRCASKKRKVM